jgi:hypothetical protein
MEVHGGLGTLAEFPVERWLREAMILAIWEGTPHRQILDGMEVMQRQSAHRLLLQQLAPLLTSAVQKTWTARIDAYLQQPQAEMEAGAEGLFRDLAAFTARTLGNKPGGI